MRITERRLRSIIRSVIKEELTNDFELLDFFNRDGMSHDRFPELKLNNDNYAHLIKKYIDNCEKKSLNCSFQDLIDDLSTKYDMSLVDKESLNKMKNEFNKYIDKLYPHSKQHLVR